MSKTLITIAGINHYFGLAPFEKGSKVKLIKEPDNSYDHEAIRVEMKGLGKVGYVANSAYTVQGMCMSAGRLYDRIDETAKAKVLFVMPNFVIAAVSKKSLLGWKPEPEEPTQEDTASPQAEEMSF